MVAEPVSATWNTLEQFYLQASSFASNQLEKVSHKLKDLDLYQYNPFQYEPEPKAITKSESIIDIVERHKVKCSIFTVGLGVGAIWYGIRANQRGKSRKKPRRRVQKLANGARKDVILVVGSPAEPLTRLIALDFERRGFIVYVSIMDEKDAKYIESNPITDDINYLNLTEGDSFEYPIGKFRQLFQVPVTPFVGAESHTMELAAVVFTPNLYFPLGPIENISMTSWAKLNDKFMVYLRLMSSGLVDLIRHHKSNTIAITPNITSSLNIPYHGPESMFQSSIESVFTTLSREVRQHGVSVTIVKLGNILILTSPLGAKTSNIVNAEIRGWSEDIKSLYSTSFTRSQFKATPIRSTGRGTTLRQLYHVLFDLAYSGSKNNPPVVYCGTGARSYSWISALFPPFLLQWIFS